MDTDRLSRAKTCSRLLRTLLDDTRQDAPDEPEAGAVLGLCFAAHQLESRIGDLLHYVEHVGRMPRPTCEECGDHVPDLYPDGPRRVCGKCVPDPIPEGDGLNREEPKP